MVRQTIRVFTPPFTRATCRLKLTAADSLCPRYLLLIDLCPGVAINFLRGLRVCSRRKGGVKFVPASGKCRLIKCGLHEKRHRTRRIVDLYRCNTCLIRRVVSIASCNEQCLRSVKSSGCECLLLSTIEDFNGFRQPGLTSIAASPVPVRELMSNLGGCAGLSRTRTACLTRHTGLSAVHTATKMVVCLRSGDTGGVSRTLNRGSFSPSLLTHCLPTPV